MSGAVAYQQNRVAGANPIELITMAYHRLLEEVAIARRGFEGNDIPGRGRAITNAWEILAELFRMLDHENGGEIAVRLSGLYDFAMRRLLDAQTGKTPKPLMDVEKVITPLLQAWESMKVQSPEPRQSTPAAAGWSSVGAFSNGGQYEPQQWTL